MAGPDDFEHLPGGLPGGEPRASPSARFRRACGALHSLPLPDGWCRVVVALPGAHHHLDMELAELRREVAQDRPWVARDRASAALAPLLLLRGTHMDCAVPHLDDTRVRLLLGYLDGASMSRAPRPWNTAGLDVSLAGGEASIQQVFCHEPWPPVALAAFRRRPGR